MPDHEPSWPDQTGREPCVVGHNVIGVTAIDERGIEEAIRVCMSIPYATIGVDLTHTFSPAAIQVVSTDGAERIRPHPCVVVSRDALGPTADAAGDVRVSRRVRPLAI